jgi:hypothetical protein
MPASLLDPALALAADVLDDLERVRIANENRLRALITVFGLDESHPDVGRLAGMVDTLGKLEHDATLQLQRQLRKHPLGPWVKAQRGVGEKQAARLLAAIGDPYWNTLHDRPRTVSELWAYSGMHVRDGEAPKRRRGERANWSGGAKMRAYLVALSCIKQMESPYRAVYDARRAHTATTRPEWTDGHSHNDALRVVAKEVLKRLWREAARLHGAEVELPEAA